MDQSIGIEFKVSGVQTVLDAFSKIESAFTKFNEKFSHSSNLNALKETFTSVAQAAKSFETVLAGISRHAGDTQKHVKDLNTQIASLKKHTDGGGGAGSSGLSLIHI